MKKNILLTAGRAELRSENGMKKVYLYAYSGGVMHPKLSMKWGGDVVVDIAGVAINAAEKPIHLGHDINKPIGHTTSISATNELVADGILSIASPDTQSVIDSAGAGFPWKSSIGVNILEHQIYEDGQTVVVNGREFQGPVLVVTSSVLEEISLVSVPGDSESYADIQARLSNGEANMPTFEEWVASLGLDVSGISDDLNMVLQKQYAEQDEDSVEAPEVVAEDGSGEEEKKPEMDAMSDEEKMAAKAKASGRIDLKAQREILAAEQSRVADVREFCSKNGNPKVSVAGKDVDLCAHAIKQGWSVRDTEYTFLKHERLQATRKDRPQVPSIHTKSSNDVNKQVLQAACALRAGIDVESKKWSHKDLRNQVPSWLRADINSDAKQQVLESAEKFRGESMIDMCAHSLRANGREVPVGRLNVLQAAFSTGAVSDLYGQTFGAKVLDGYSEIKDFSEGWTVEGENPDMESHDRIRMEAAGNLDYLPIGGEASHARRATKVEKSKVHRFAKQMELDEADILGDNFGKLKETPRDFGLAAGRVRPDLVASIILDDPTLNATSRNLFNTTDGNKFGSAALSRASLSAAIAAMKKFKDGDAILNLEPTHLLVPPELYDLAIQLTQSTRNATTNANEGEVNPLSAYNIQVVSEARLALGLTDPVSKAAYSGSASTWYLVSNQAHTIECTYMQAAGRAPIVRTTELTNGRFGVNFDVRLYLGAVPLDWRGLVYNQSAGL